MEEELSTHTRSEQFCKDTFKVRHYNVAAVIDHYDSSELYLRVFSVDKPSHWNNVCEGGVGDFYFPGLFDNSVFTCQGSATAHDHLKCLFRVRLTHVQILRRLKSFMFLECGIPYQGETPPGEGGIGMGVGVGANDINLWRLHPEIAPPESIPTFQYNNRTYIGEEPPFLRAARINDLYMIPTSMSRTLIEDTFSPIGRLLRDRRLGLRRDRALQTTQRMSHVMDAAVMVPYTFQRMSMTDFERERANSFPPTPSLRPGPDSTSSDDIDDDNPSISSNIPDWPEHIIISVPVDREDVIGLTIATLDRLLHKKKEKKDE